MINIENLQKVISSMPRFNHVKKIKVTTLFYHYIKLNFKVLAGSPIDNKFIDSHFGIPIEIDDEIEGNYEFVY